MRISLCLLSVLLLSLPTSRAEDKQPLRVTVQKRALETEKARVGPEQRVLLERKTVTLHTTVKNLGTKTLEAMSIKATVKLNRSMGPMRTTPVEESFKAQLPVLKLNEEVEVDIGEIQLRSNNVSNKDDVIVGWKLLFEFADGRQLEFDSAGGR